MIRRVLALVLLLCFCLTAPGVGPKTVAVRGYTRKDGTYVRPHVRSAPSRSSSPIARQPSPSPLWPSPARVQPRVNAPVTPRIEPRLEERTLPNAPTFAPTPTPEEQEEVLAYIEAKRQYDSLRALDFAKKLSTKAASDQWYRGVIHDYRGTVAAEEAQSRLDGNAPKWLPVPPLPVPPKAKQTRR
jgi:hypothetical protein